MHDALWFNNTGFVGCLFNDDFATLHQAFTALQDRLTFQGQGSVFDLKNGFLRPGQFIAALCSDIAFAVKTLPLPVGIGFGDEGFTADKNIVLLGNGVALTATASWVLSDLHAVAAKHNRRWLGGGHKSQ